MSLSRSPLCGILLDCGKCMIHASGSKSGIVIFLMGRSDELWKLPGIAARCALFLMGV
jgi:hypothetical protein